ncbi:MAG: hypothetical protein ACRERS_04485 [Methylococcales bacterium]
MNEGSRAGAWESAHERGPRAFVISTGVEFAVLVTMAAFTLLFTI